MKRFVNFFKNDRLWQMLVALFFAVVLFFTAWSGNTQNKNNSSNLLIEIAQILVIFALISASIYVNLTVQSSGFQRYVKV